MREKLIAKSSVEADPVMERLRCEYKEWKTNQRDNKIGFFMIYNDLFTSGKLKDINSNALKIYIYFGIHSNNDTGECWHSVEAIAEYFNIDKRTVNRALKNLEEINLISRVQKGFRRVANTFLRPY